MRKNIIKLSKIMIKLEDDLSALERCNISSNSSSTVSLLQYTYSQIEAEIHNKQEILNSLIEENCNLIKKKEKITLTVQDITKTIYFTEKGDISKYSIESKIEENINLISEELENISKELATKNNFLTELNSLKKLKEGIRLNLLSKIQRTKEYRNKEERNLQLQEKVNSMSEQIKNLEEEVNILSIRKEELIRSKQFLDGEIKNLKKQWQEQEDSFGQNIFQAKQELNNLLDSMR